jgi:cell division protein FtsL
VEPVLLIVEQYALHLWLLLLLLVIATGVGVILAYRQIRQLHRRYGELLTSGDGKELGELLSMYVEQMGLAASKAEELAETSDRLERRLANTIGRMGLVRFNAFEGTGGEQSFALALLDDQGNGVVLSSLQGRGENRLYAKTVRKWASPHNLSVEEKDAIGQAHESEVDKKPRL